MTRPAARRTFPLQAADALTIAAALAAIGLLLLGPARIVFAGTPVSVRWTHAAFLAVAVAAVRHALVRDPSVLVFRDEWTDWIRRRPVLADAILVWLVTRPAVLVVGLAAAATFGVLPSSEQPPSERYLLRDLPARFDANWYAGIAADGYDWQARFDRQQNVAFFPAYPMLMRGAGVLTGAYAGRVPPERRITRFAWAGLAVSLAAFLGAAWYFAAVARDVLGPERGRAALLLLAAYPFAAYFSAAYTESLFLLAAVGTWYHARRGEYVRAGALGLLLGLTRPNGFFLSVPLGLMALGIRDARPDHTGGATDEPATPGAARGRSTGLLVVASMPVLGMLVFTWWLFDRTGVWFAWARVHAAWGRVVSTWDVQGGIEALGSQGLLRIATDNPYQALNALGLLFALGLIGTVWRHVAPVWAAYVLVTVGAPLLAGGVLSMGRLTSTLFPLFLALAAVLPARAVPVVAAVFAMMQGLVAALFYTWRAMY